MPYFYDCTTYRASTSDDITEMFNELRFNTTLLKLDLRKLLLTNNNIQYLVECLRDNTSLKKLILYGCNLTNGFCMNNINVRKFKLTNGYISTKVLVEILSNPNLTSLFLSGTHIDDDAIPIITNTQLTKLDISYCTFNIVKTKELCAAFSTDKTLEDLKFTPFNDDDVSTILENNTTLKSLTLYPTGFLTKPEELNNIVASLCNNNTLRHLSLMTNFNEGDIINFSRIFRYNNTLETFRIFSYTGNDCADEVINNLERNYCFREFINFSHPKVTEYLSEDKRMERLQHYRRHACTKRAKF